MDEDRCLSPIRGLSALERRDEGLEGGCSDSEELEATDEELDMVGDRVGRTCEEHMFALVELGSGYGFVAIVSQWYRSQSEHARGYSPQ